MQALLRYNRLNEFDKRYKKWKKDPDLLILYFERLALSFQEDEMLAMLETFTSEKEKASAFKILI